MNEMFEDPDSILFRQNPALFARRENALDVLRQCQRQIVQTLPNYKQVLCPRFEKYGFCRYSDFCHYAHGENEILNLNYKRIMCINPGSCPYGKNCKYAHSEHERLSLTHKTAMCYSFPCPPWENCRYAHTPDEIRNISDNIRLWKSSFQTSKMDVKQKENDGMVLNSSNAEWLIAKSNLNPNAVPFLSASDSLNSGSNSSTMSCSTKTVLNNSDLNPNAIPFFSPNEKVLMWKWKFQR